MVQGLLFWACALIERLKVSVLFQALPVTFDKQQKQHDR